MNRILSAALAAGTLALAAASFAQNPPAGQGRPGGGQGRQGGMGGGMMMMMGGGLPPASMAVNRNDVQKDLKLTEAQKAELAKLREAQMAAFGGGRPGGQGQGGQGQGGRQGAGFDREAMMARFKEADAKVLAILDEAQKTRMRQIQIQLAGLNAFLDDSVAAELSITASQKRDITRLQESMNEANRGMFASVRDGSMTMEEVQKATENNNKVALEEAMKLMDEAQKTKYAAIIGTKFNAEPQPMGRRGGGF
jgi:hypothetical protein